MSVPAETLYRINDVLTALMGELDAYAGLDEDEVDRVLQDLTWSVVEAFRLDESGEKCPSCGQSYKDAHADGCEFGLDNQIPGV